MRLGLSTALVAQGPALRQMSGSPLFADGQVGFQFDPSVSSSMSVARDGSGPTPAIGDVVGRIEDISGNGFAAVAPSDASRPRLEMVRGRPALSFDGVDDVLRLANMTFGPLFSVFVGFEHFSNGMVLGALSGATPPINKVIRAGSNRVKLDYPDAAGTDQLLTAEYGINPSEVYVGGLADSLTLDVEGMSVETKSVPGGLAEVTSELFIGDGAVGGGDPIEMALFGMVVYPTATVDSSTEAAARAWLSTQTGRVT